MQFLVRPGLEAFSEGPDGRAQRASSVTVAATSVARASSSCRWTTCSCSSGCRRSSGRSSDWGPALESKQLVTIDTVHASRRASRASTPIGDINTYPGKKKLILSGFHEAALAAFAIKERLNPGKKVHLQYTTTSPVMHERLGVDDPYAEEVA